MNTVRLTRPIRRILVVAVSLVLILVFSLSAFANVPVTQIGRDPYTNTTSQHATQVEPDTFAFGTTLVAAAKPAAFRWRRVQYLFFNLHKQWPHVDQWLFAGYHEVRHPRLGPTIASVTR